MIEALFTKAGRELVNRKWLSAKQTGYRWFPACSVEEACRQQSTTVTVHMSRKTVFCPLPENVASRDELSRDRGRYGRSFYDVPELSVEGRWSATLKNVRAIRYRSRWGDDYYALITDRDHLLKVAGGGWKKEHRDVLNGNSVFRRIESAAWVTTHSTRNHHEWLYTHLPRVLMAQKIGLADKILLPEKQLLSEVKQETLRRLGIENPQFIQPWDEVILFGELTVFGVDGFDPQNLLELRNRLAGSRPDVKPHRRLLISRENCSYRKLNKHTIILDLLRPFGFEEVRFEELTLQQQIDLLQETEILMGPHGAGFANLLFCQPGTKVIEIQDPDAQNPHFYILAALLGLRCWLLRAEVDRTREVLYRDLTICPAKLVEIIKGVV